MKELNDFPLWTAIITPFSNDFTVDYTALKTLLKMQQEANNAVVLLGSTGEGAALSFEERQDIVSFTCSLNLSVPLMVGVGGQLIEEQKKWISWLNDQNVDAYLLVTPPYAKPGAFGQKYWFESLLNCSQRPCMLYNVPGRSSVAMDHFAVKELSEHPHFWAIKEASGSVSEFKKYRDKAPNARMYSGDDALTFDFCREGGVGLVSIASNVWPKETHSFVNHCLQNHGEEVKKWPRWAETFFLASNPVPVKALAHQKGLISTPTVRLPLSAQDLASLDLLNQADLQVCEWYQANESKRSNV